MKRYALVVCVLIVMVWLLWWFQGLDRIDDALTKLLVWAITGVCAAIFIAFVLAALMARAELKRPKEVGEEYPNS